MTDLADYLAAMRRDVEAALDLALPAEAAPPLIVEAMQYALLGGGKRLRPCLTLAVADAVGVAAGLAPSHARLLALPSACAVEMVHTYSLVHDDLPAMDDDALRRGRPTTHVVYGDGIAILAGDGLLTEAFNVLAASPSPVLPRRAPEPKLAARLETIRLLAAAAGACGMVGGQTVDLAVAGRTRSSAASPAKLDRTGLEDMHERKTGALIHAAAMMGAVATGANEAKRTAIGTYARALGLAFQIIDDILDVEGSPADLGKTAGKDAAAHKLTYPALHGVEVSRRMAADCIAQAKAALEGSGVEGRLLELADWTLTRRG